MARGPLVAGLKEADSVERGERPGPKGGRPQGERVADGRIDPVRRDHQIGAATGALGQCERTIGLGAGRARTASC